MHAVSPPSNPRGRGHPRNLAVGEAGDAGDLAETLAAGDLRVDHQFGPRVDAVRQENGRSQGYPVLWMRWEAVFSFVEGRKGSMVLPDGGGLEMHTPAVSGGVATGALRLGGEPGVQNTGDQQNEWTVHEHVFSPLIDVQKVPYAF